MAYRGEQRLSLTRTAQHHIKRRGALRNHSRNAQGGRGSNQCARTRHKLPRFLVTIQKYAVVCTCVASILFLYGRSPPEAVPSDERLLFLVSYSYNVLSKNAVGYSCRLHTAVPQSLMPNSYRRAVFWTNKRTR